MYEDYEDLVERLRECTAEQNREKTLWCQAADTIDNLLYICKHQAEELRNIPKWISVAERLPKYGTKVLVFAYGHDVLTARLCKEAEFDYPVFDCNGIYNELAKQGRITHWMPLPSAPMEE